MDKNVMVVVIVALVMVASVIKSWTKTSKRKEDDKPVMPDAATQAKLHDLEERVKILERIVTDKSSRLKEEIDAL